MLSRISLVALVFLMLCPLTLWADEQNLPDPNSYQGLGWFVAAVFGIVGLANQGMSLWNHLFPRPSPAAHETYATKIEIKELEREHNEELERIETRFSEWMEQNQKQHTDSVRELRRALEAFGEWQRTIERALGHVETKADLGIKQRPRG
jgi:hypothetical protein